MDVYVLKLQQQFGGSVVSVHARRQGADARMADFTAAEQAQMEIANFELQDLD